MQIGWLLRRGSRGCHLEQSNNQLLQQVEVVEVVLLLSLPMLMPMLLLLLLLLVSRGRLQLLRRSQ